MSNIKEAFQRFLSIALSVTTTVWLSGLALLLPMSPALAVAPGDYGLREGDLIRAPSLAAPEGWKVYIINQTGYKRHIFNPDVFNMYGHLKWENIKDVSADVVNAFMTSDLYRVDGDQKVWSVGDDGVKHWINMSAAEFTTKGYKWEQVFIVNGTEGNYYTQGSDITGTTTPPPPVSGAVSVSLSPNTMPSGVIAAGTVFNKVTTLRFTAGSQTALITGLTISKGGLLANNLVSGISIWKGDMRQGNILTSLTSDGKASFTFGTPIEVLANSSIDLDVAANISSSATSGTVNMMVNSGADVMLSGGGSASGTFPITGNTFSIVSSGAVGAYTLTAQAVGGASPDFPASGSGNLEIGIAQKELAKFQFNETTGREDMMIKQLTVYLQGSIQANDLKNWKLYSPEGTELAVGTVTMPYVDFTLGTAYRVPEGTTRTLSVKADPMDGADRTVRVHVQNDYDMMVKGNETGAYVAPSSFTDQAPSDGYWRLKQGQLTVSVTPGSPSGNIPVGAQEAVLAKFDLRAVGEQLEIRKMDLEIVEPLSTTSSQQLTGNVKVQSGDGAVTYLSLSADTTNLQRTSDATESTRFDLNNYLIIPSGTTKTIQVIGTVKTTATASQTYKAKIGNFYAWRTSTKDFADLLASSYTSGNILTVQTSALTVARNASVAAKTVAKGVNDIVVGSFVIQAGSAEGINVSGINIKYDTDADDDNDATDDASADLTNVSLWIGGAQFGTTVGTPSTGISADSFSGTLSVAKSETKVVDVKANVKTSASGTVKIWISTVSATGQSTSNSITATNSNDDVDLDTTAGEAIADDNPVGQLITYGSGTLTISKDGSSAIPQILTAGKTGVELSKVRFEALNDTLKLEKVRFEMSAAGKGKYISKLYLCDGTSDTTTACKDGKSLSADEALFDGLAVSLPAGGSKTLTVKADLAGYEVIAAASDISTLAVQVKSDSSDDLQVTGTSGTLVVGDINGAGSNTDIAASSTFLFHATSPVLAKSSISSTTLGGSTAQEVYKFTVKSATAGIPIRVGSMKIRVTVSGMNTAGSVSTFELWKGSEKVAQDTTTILSTTTSATTLTFDSTNDVNDSFDPDSSVATALDGIEVSDTAITFTLKADTTDVLDGKTTGTVTLTVQVQGNTGVDTGDTDQEDGWGDGNVFYSYKIFNTTTYIGGTSSTTGFTASDTLPIDSQTLSVTL